MIFFIKAIITLGGLVYSLINLIPGLQGDKKKLKKAFVIFFSTWLLLILISVVDFLPYV
jgi:hypothetical protein